MILQLYTDDKEEVFVQFVVSYNLEIKECFHSIKNSRICIILKSTTTLSEPKLMRRFSTKFDFWKIEDLMVYVA